MAERNAAAGYMAIGKQPAATTPVIPNVLTPYYKQSLETGLNLIADKPVYGNKFDVFQQLQGTRSHKGSLTVMAEPNTAGYWLDMLLTRVSTTGVGPYTHTFQLSNTQDPNYYTVDVSLVSQVVRFFGIAASKMSWMWQNEELQFDMAASALGSFMAREIASISLQVLTLTTTYDPNPTTGLVVGDLIAIKSTDGTVNLNTLTISALTNTTVTVTGTITSAAAGNMLVLRPNNSLTPSLGTPFIWPLANYKWGATAAAALAGAQTRIEPGTSFDIAHNFESDNGQPRSGGFDPASLIRTTGMYNFKAKQYFDNADQWKQFMAINKQGATQQFFSGTSAELRVILNHMKEQQLSPPTSFGQTVYQEITYGPQYDQTDGQALSVVLINNVATY